MLRVFDSPAFTWNERKDEKLWMSWDICQKTAIEKKHEVMKWWKCTC
jgi:hypothetical protein